jgi:Transposase DDE domain group 1
MVRGQPHRLRLRAARFEAAVEENRRGGGCGAHRARFVEQARRARLRRNAPQGQILEPQSGAPSPASKPRPLGLDTRFVVTNVEYGAAEWVYNAFYCTRGQAENLIKLHKTQLASDRTSCRSAMANQVRLALHTAAYWLMLTVRDAIPKPRDLANAEFSTLRLRLIKIAARVIETASRVRLAFAAGCPEADLFRGLPGALAPLGP